MTPLIHSQALSRSPDHSKILHLYATFLHKSTKRQHQTSARLWQRAVLLAPRDADILTGYGTLLHRVMCKPEVFTRALVSCGSCSVVVQLLFSCCSVVVQLLFSCCSVVVQLLFSCCCSSFSTENRVLTIPIVLVLFSSRYRMQNP
jgi:hypothetical protein